MTGVIRKEFIRKMMFGAHGFSVKARKLQWLRRTGAAGVDHGNGLGAGTDCLGSVARTSKPYLYLVSFSLKIHIFSCWCLA